MIYGKVSKLSTTFILCTFPDSIPASVNWVLRDHCHCQLKTESELTFCCRRGLFWSFDLLSLFDG
jgi:hypothetical protein